MYHFLSAPIVQKAGERRRHAESRHACSKWLWEGTLLDPFVGGALPLSTNIFISQKGAFLSLLSAKIFLCVVTNSVKISKHMACNRCMVVNDGGGWTCDRPNKSN